MVRTVEENMLRDGIDLSNAVSAKFTWVFRYKLHHLPFWFLYHYLWWTLKIGDPRIVAANIFSTPLATKFFFYLFFQAAGVYFNLYYLIPRFLEMGRYLPYVVLLLLTIVATSALIVTGYYAGALLSDLTFLELYKRPPQDYYYFFENNALPSTMASMTLAMSIKLTRNWIDTKRRAQRLQLEKMETELKFLRAQFNPHFLFNTINSIFVLINKNPKTASESLAKFSELLRYQLYECNEHRIMVRQELTYLENFVELERLRQDGHVTMHVRIKRPLSHSLEIAPFIIMPFVENAFKHVSRHRDRDNWITIDLWFVERQLHLRVANSTGHQVTSSDLPDYGGIGLQNVERRLSLLYPGSYHLAVDNSNQEFHINLVLELDADPQTVRHSSSGGKVLNR